MLQNWIGSLGRILTRKPPRSPKGEVSMHGKIRDIQWVQEAKTENASKKTLRRKGKKFFV